MHIDTPAGLFKPPLSAAFSEIFAAISKTILKESSPASRNPFRTHSVYG
jgi:hypothetical protein